MARSADFFTFTKICSYCNGNMKTFRIPLDITMRRVNVR